VPSWSSWRCGATWPSTTGSAPPSQRSGPATRCSTRQSTGSVAALHAAPCGAGYDTWGPAPDEARSDRQPAATQGAIASPGTPRTPATRGSSAISSW